VISSSACLVHLLILFFPAQLFKAIGSVVQQSTDALKDTDSDIVRVLGKFSKQ